MVEVRIIEPQKEEIKEVTNIIDEYEINNMINNHLCDNNITIQKEVKNDSHKIQDKYEKVQISEDSFLNIKIEIRTEGF